MSDHAETAPPGDDVETDVDRIIQRIVEIWSAVLDVPDLTADSHLLDLGANSLIAVKIRSRIRYELGREIDLMDVLENPTPRELGPVVATAELWAGTEPWDALDWSDPDDDWGLEPDPEPEPDPAPGPATA